MSASPTAAFRIFSRIVLVLFNTWVRWHESRRIVFERHKCTRPVLTGHARPAHRIRAPARPNSPPGTHTLYPRLRRVEEKVPHFAAGCSFFVSDVFRDL